MALNINEIRRISREAKEAERRKAKEKIDTVWRDKVMPDIERSITSSAEIGKDSDYVYVYNRFWDFGKVAISSEEEFSYVFNLISEYFEGFKVEATCDDSIFKREIIISWAEDIEEEMVEEEKLPF